MGAFLCAYPPFVVWGDFPHQGGELSHRLALGVHPQSVGVSGDPLLAALEGLFPGVGAFCPRVWCCALFEPGVSALSIGGPL